MPEVLRGLLLKRMVLLGEVGEILDGGKLKEWTEGRKRGYL
jgi:hypothetical protein